MKAPLLGYFSGVKENIPTTHLLLSLSSKFLFQVKQDILFNILFLFLVTKIHYSFLNFDF